METKDLLIDIAKSLDRLATATEQANKNHTAEDELKAAQHENRGLDRELRMLKAAEAKAKADKDPII